MREDGARREVLRVTPATSPMPVAILVDNSQAARDHIADIRKALTSFVKTMSGVGPIAIVGVADRPTILRDYTTNQKQLLDGVSKVFAMPDSGATLLDAIVEISKGLQKREEDRAAMVMLTTENTEFSNRHYNEVLEALAKGGADDARDGADHAGGIRRSTMRRAIARPCSIAVRARAAARASTCWRARRSKASCTSSRPSSRASIASCMRARRR